MHDGTRYKPPPKGNPSSSSVDPAPQTKSEGKELAQKGRLFCDKVGSFVWQLTDVLTQEQVTLPPGTWELLQWDDLDEFALVGTHKHSGEEAELDIDDLLQTRAWVENQTGIDIQC